MKELEAIKVRAEAATVGPWESGHVHGRVDHARNGIRFTVADLAYRDADFIAHARTDIPKLIAALEAVEEVQRRVSQQAVDRYHRARVLPFDERAVAAAAAAEFEVIASDLFAAIIEALA